MSLRVYALTNRAPLVRPPRGIDGERLRLVPVGAVAAIVGEAAPRRRDIDPAALRRYDAVVGRLAGGRASILPARFATEFPSLDELGFVLRARESSLRMALARVRGRAQMTIRLADPGAAQVPPAGRRGASAPDAAPADASGAAYLRRRAAHAARHRAIPGFDPVRAAAHRWVRAELVERKAGVVTVYHLVPRASAAAYRRAVERAAAASGLRVAVSGPWAPYAFTAW